MMIVFILALLIIVTKGYREVPVTQNVAVGAKAGFRCQHPTADTIRWNINGSLLGRNPPPDITPGTIRDDNGNLVDILTITALPEYNGTEIVCVARFDDERPEESTQPALLLVYTGEFLLYPESVNVTEDAVAIFQCQHTTADGVSWKINGSNLTSFSQCVFAEIQYGNTFTLNITALPKCNQTAIVCVAHSVDSQLNEETKSVTMMVQGDLDSVTEVRRNSSTLSWIPPFSLDLSGVDPDIVYCVQVFNITCGRMELVISDCNVTEPSYTSDDISPHGYIYKYIITPRSNVEGARNGSNTTVIEQFICLNESARGWRVSVVSKSLTNVTLTVNVCHKSQDAVKPAALSAVLNSVDGIQDYDRLVVPVAATPGTDNNSVDIILEVPFRRVLDITVIAYDCKEHPLTDTIELGTHDIYDISVSSPVPGVVMVTCDVIFGSTSRGILVVVYSDVDISYSYVPHNNTQEGVYSIGVELPDNQYQVSVFAVEESYEPFRRAAERPTSVFINGSSEIEHEPSPIQYKLQPISTGVCITCTFLDSSTPDCVAVVHQRISQLNSSGLMNIESSHKFNRSEDTAYGCIEGVNLEQHQIGVVNGNEILVVSDNILQTVIVVIVSTPVSLVMVVVIVVVIVVTIICLKAPRKQIFNSLNLNKKGYNIDTEFDADMSARQSMDEEVRSLHDEEMETTFVSSISSTDQDPNSQPIGSPTTEKKLDLPLPSQGATIKGGPTQTEAIHDKESADEHSHTVEDGFEEAQSEHSDMTQMSLWVVNCELNKDVNQTKEPPASSCSADLESTISGGGDHSDKFVKRKEKSRESGFGSYCNSEPNSYNLLKVNIPSKNDLPLETIVEEEDKYAPMPFQGTAENSVVDELTKTSYST